MRLPPFPCIVRHMLTSERVWLVLFTLLFLVFLGATVGIIVQAGLDAEANLPKEIDAVVWERGKQVSMYQVRAIRRNMPFIKKIYVLRDGSAEDVPDLCTYVPFSANNTLSSAFLAVSDISGIHSHAIFFGDYTWPLINISKTYLFAGSRPRMFNFLREHAEQLFFSQYLNETVPTMVFEVQNLKDARVQSNNQSDDTLRSLMMQEAGESRLVTRTDINRDIFLNAAYPDTMTKQIKGLSSHTPLFATIHVSGTNQAAALKQWTEQFLMVHFSV